MKIPRLQYISDLHLEHRKQIIKIPAKSRYLSLLGDIGNPFQPLYKEQMKYCSDHFEKTIVIAGNHEYDFCKDRGTTDCAILKVTQDTRNVVFLNNSSLVLENHRILG